MSEQVIYVDDQVPQILRYGVYQYIGMYCYQDFIPKFGYPIYSWVFSSLQSAETCIDEYTDYGQKFHLRLDLRPKSYYANNVYGSSFKHNFVCLDETKVITVPGLRQLIREHDQLIRSLKRRNA